MASSVSGQKEANPELCLATWAGKMGSRCGQDLTHWGVVAVSCKKMVFFLYNWSDINLMVFGRGSGIYWQSYYVGVFMDLDCVPVHKHAMKKEPSQYLAILMSGLVKSRENLMYYHLGSSVPYPIAWLCQWQKNRVDCDWWIPQMAIISETWCLNENFYAGLIVLKIEHLFSKIRALDGKCSSNYRG